MSLVILLFILVGHSHFSVSQEYQSQQLVYRSYASLVVLHKHSCSLLAVPAVTIINKTQQFSSSAVPRTQRNKEVNSPKVSNFNCTVLRTNSTAQFSGPFKNISLQLMEVQFSFNIDPEA